VTRDPDLADRLHRLAAAVGVPLQVAGRVEDVSGPLTARPGLLADGPAADELLRLPAGPRPRAVLIGADPPPDSLWRQAVALRAERVLALPGDDDQVMEWLLDLTDAPRAAATVLGVVGGRGGAGASTLAAALAKTAARTPATHVFLVDLDPLGGGLELVLGCEDAPGLRWPQVASTRGRISPSALWDALPHEDGVALLSWPREVTTDVEAHVVPGLMDSMRRGADLVIVDLARHPGNAVRAALPAVDTVLLLGTADVRGAAGTLRVLHAVRDECSDVRLVVRVSRSPAVSPEAIADSLAVPLVGRVPAVRGMETAISQGLGPPVGGRFGRACRRLLDSLAHPSGSS
jgi:secretion/DNA translocation related CpaE-like protein